DRDVALEVGALVALPEHAQRLPCPPAEARVRGERDRDVEVEDPLREALIGIGRRVEEDERDRRCQQHNGQPRAHRDTVLPHARHGSSAMTYSNVAQASSAKIASYSTRNQR